MKTNAGRLLLMALVLALLVPACLEEDDGDTGGSSSGPTAPPPPSRPTMTITTSTGARITVFRDSLRFNINSTSNRRLNLRWLSSCASVFVSWEDISSFQPIRDVPCGDRVCGSTVGCGGESWRVQVVDPSRSGLGQTATNSRYRVSYERTNGVRESLSFENINLIN